MANKPYPHNLDAERAVLGALLLEPDRIASVVELLPEPIHFFRLAHQYVYAAMLRLYRAGTPIDFRSLQDTLTATKQIDEVGVVYLSSLVDGVPKASNVAYYATTVRNDAVQRSVMSALDHALEAIGEQGITDEILDGLRAVVSIDALTPPALAHERRVVEELARERARRAARRCADAEERGSVAWPDIESLSDRLGRPRAPKRWRIRDWHPWGARTMTTAAAKTGKTTLTGNRIRSLVDGDRFLGIAQVTPITGTYVLLNTEMSADQTDDWLADQGIHHQDRVIPITLKGSAASFDIIDAACRAEWAARFRERGAEFLDQDGLRPILDAIGLDEHKDAGRFLVAFDALLAEAGIADANLTHHMGHSQERARGDSRLCDCPRRTWAKCAHPWHFSFKWDGTHHRFSLDRHLKRHIASKTEAEAEADSLRAQIRSGAFGSSLPARDVLTVRQLCDEYRTAYLEPRHGPARPADTYQMDSLCRVALRLPTGEVRGLGSWRVVDVSTATLEQLRTVLQVTQTVAREGRGARRTGGPIAANRSLGYLRAIFNWAIRAGHVEKSPYKRGTETVIRLTRENKRSRRLQEGEERRLLSACGPHLRSLVEAALATGMRLGELLGLQWAEVVLGAGEIRLRPERTKTKTGRTIPIGARLRAILTMRQTDADGETFAAAAYVFGNEIGQRVGSIKTAWRAACRRADIDDLHFHDLRREAGSRWLDGGVPLHTVRDWLGHTSVAQTSTYLATTAKTSHAAMAAFDMRSTALGQAPNENRGKDHFGLTTI